MSGPELDPIEADTKDWTWALQRPEPTVPAGTFARVSGDQWHRRGMRSNDSSFSVQTLAQYFVHDVAHHLHDVCG